MKIFMQKAKEQDLEEINKMLTNLIQDERQYDSNINEKYEVYNYYQQFLNQDNSHIIVAKNEENSILGYGFGYIIDYANVYKEKIAQLDAIYVKSEYRENSIARKIIQSFIEWAKGKNVKYIELKVCKDNNNAIDLYKREGFGTEKLIFKKRITAEAIETAKNKLEELSKDEHERELAELRDKYVRDQKSIERYGYNRGVEAGKEEGIKQGIKQGIEQNIRYNVINMLKENIPDEVIMRVTNISEEELENIKKC